MPPDSPSSSLRSSSLSESQCTAPAPIADCRSLCVDPIEGAGGLGFLDRLDVRSRRARACGRSACRPDPRLAPPHCRRSRAWRGSGSRHDRERLHDLVARAGNDDGGAAGCRGNATSVTRGRHHGEGIGATTVDAGSDAGSTTLSFATPPHAVDATSHRGDVSLGLPKRLVAYRVDPSAGGGSTHTPVTGPRAHHEAPPPPMSL